MAARTPLVLFCAAAVLHITAASEPSVPLPAEVVVSSDTSFVKGNSRGDRLLATNSNAGITVLGSDGIPVVYGVRVHETEEERNEPVWRNARVIDNKLFTSDDMPPVTALKVIPSPSTLMHDAPPTQSSAATSQTSAGTSSSSSFRPSLPSLQTPTTSFQPLSPSSSSLPVYSSAPTIATYAETTLDSVGGEPAEHRRGRVLNYNGGSRYGSRRKSSSPPYYYQSYNNANSEDKYETYQSSQRQQEPTRNQQALYNNFQVGDKLSISETRRNDALHKYSNSYQKAESVYSTDETITTPPVYVAFSDSSLNEPAKQLPKHISNREKYEYTSNNKLKHSLNSDRSTNVNYYSGKHDLYSGGGYPLPSVQTPTVYPSPTLSSPTSAHPTAQRIPTVIRPSIQPSSSQLKKRFQAIQPSQTPTTSGKFRFPSKSVGSSLTQPSAQKDAILSPGSYELPQAAVDFQNSVDPFSGRPVNPNQFQIKQMAFQSVPGGPIVNIPVPIPNGQQTKTKKPTRRFSLLGGLFGGGSKRPAYDRVSQYTDPSAPATLQQQYLGSSSSYASTDYDYDYERPTLYNVITNPIRRLGAGVIEFTRPVTQPFRDVTERLSEELGLTPYSSSDQYLADKADGAVDPNEALLVGGLVASAGALAGLSFLVYANTVTNDTHYIIGRRKRSLNTDGILDNLVGDLSNEEASFLDVLREEGFQRWSQGPCAKRLFCDFMTNQESETLERITSKVSTFLSYLDRGEPDGLMAQARELQRAIERRDCATFSCGDAVDASQIRDANDSNRARRRDGQRRASELRPR